MIPDIHLTHPSDLAWDHPSKPRTIEAYRSYLPFDADADAHRIGPRRVHPGGQWDSVGEDFQHGVVDQDPQLEDVIAGCGLSLIHI